MRHGRDDSRGPRPLTVGVGLALLLLTGTTLRAGDEEAAARSFDRDVEALYQGSRQGSPGAALRRLQDLLERHAGRPYAWGRRAEIEDLAERLAFGAAHAPPQASDVLGGRVERYDAGSGELRIEYDLADSADLVRLDGGHVLFPPATRGPFVLEIAGDSYPPSPDDSPCVALAEPPDAESEAFRGWRMIIGTPAEVGGARPRWMPAQIARVDGDREETLAEREAVSIPLNRPYRIQVKVSRTQIAIGVNGKTFCTAKKPKDAWGYVSFQVTNWRRMRFSGTVETAWIQDRLDRAVAEQREAFARTWDPRAVLPDWLYEPLDTGPLPPDTERPDLPAEVPPAHWDRMEAIGERIEEAAWQEAEREVRALRAEGGPEAVCAYLLGRIHAEADLPRDALEEIDACLRAAPDFLEGLLLRGALLLRLGRGDEALGTLERALETHPRAPEAYEAAAMTMLVAGRPEAAKRVTQQALARGVTSEELIRLAGAVVRATRGPTWSRVHEYRSRNYVVASDIDEQTCREAARMLEESLTAFRVGFRWVERDASRVFRVYLFSGQAGFARYLQEVSNAAGQAPGDAAGVYSPVLKQLLIWNLPDKEEMLGTIRHEGFHQYLDMLLPDPPTWLNEGLACYHEKAVRNAGRLEHGVVDPRYVALLEKEGLVPLAQFLRWTHREFYAGGERGYAQAWLLVHLLARGGEAQRALLEGVVTDLLTVPAQEAIPRRFPPDALERLDRDLRQHLVALAAE